MSEVTMEKPATAVELGLETQEIPSTEEGIRKHAFDPEVPNRPMCRIIATCTVKMIRSETSISVKNSQIVFNILQSLNSLERITAELDKSERIRDLLRSILGETPRPTKPYEYPEPLQRTAAILLARIDADLTAEQALEQAGSLSPEPSPTSPHRRKRRHTSRSATPAPIPIDDPKVKDVMRGIIISEDGRRIYKLDQDARRSLRDCNVIGHNGLTVGQWWPLRVCAIRDGAHGAMMAGIAGGANVGAFSIVVSSMYISSTSGDEVY